jgi:hypothetical protein
VSACSALVMRENSLLNLFILLIMCYVVMMQI